MRSQPCSESFWMNCVELQRLLLSILIVVVMIPVPRWDRYRDATAPSPPRVNVPFDAHTTARHLRQAVEGREYAAALRDLNQFATAAPTLYRLNNYDYLHARLALRTGNLELAKQLFQSVLKRSEQVRMLTPFCLHYLADIARREQQAGRPAAAAEERAALARLVREFPTHPVARQATQRLAENYAAAGQFDAALTLYRRLASRSRENEAALGQLLCRTGNEAEARPIFHRLLATGKDDAALLAAEELDAQGDVPLAPADRLARARLYLANRHTEGAKRHFRVLAEHVPALPYRAEALWSIGRAFFIEENWDAACYWFERAHEAYPTSPDGEKSYYQSGHALQNAGRYREAVARYEAFISEYPRSEFLGGAHLNAIDTLRLAGEFDAALAWCDRTEARFPRELAGVTARFQRAKIWLTCREFGRALVELEALQRLPLGRRGPGATNAMEVTFLRGLCLERLERFAEAVDVYLSLPDTRTGYYGQMATERLLALTQVAQARSVISHRLARLRQADTKDALQQALRLTTEVATRRELLAKLEAAYRRLPAYARAWSYRVPDIGRAFIADAAAAPTVRTAAEELAFLGLYDDALAVLEAPPRDPFAQAVYAGRGNQAWKALAYSEPTLGTLPEDFHLEVMPRQVAELLYPAPYKDELLEYARPRGVDARFLLAIARQESRFNPTVKSPVGARGLFQFIDATADRMAQTLKLTAWTRTDLYNPRTAAQFAAAYVGELFALFPQHPAAVAAAYNGGETAAARWRARAGNDDHDRFAAEIGYVETKDYVFKVMTNYRAYRQLFDADLRPRQPSRQ